MKKDISRDLEETRSGLTVTPARKSSERELFNVDLCFLYHDDGLAYSSIHLRVAWHILISHVPHGYSEAGPIFELVVCGHLNKETSTLWLFDVLNDSVAFLLTFTHGQPHVYVIHSQSYKCHQRTKHSNLK